MVPLPPLLDPARSAHASIEGYLYQAYLGVKRWLTLGDNEVLRCEGDEDLDHLLLEGGGGVSEQVKSLTGGVTIRDEVVKQTLRRFVVSQWQLRTSDPPDLRRFVFTTTASLKSQRVDDRVGVDILESWRLAKQDERIRELVVGAIRNLLRFGMPSERHRRQLIFWQRLENALSWLDEVAERWAELIRSIDWHFGEPDINEIRRDIGGELAKLRSGVPEVLIDRLLATVLDASIAPNPSERILTHGRLLSLLEETEAELANWHRGARGRRLIERLDDLARLRGVLYEKSRKLPRSPRLNELGQDVTVYRAQKKSPPSKLLTAAYEVIPFDETGRTEILDDLAAWCGDDHRALVRLIYGEGGVGKTRLFIEWCRRLRAQGWLAGFLEPSATEEELGYLLKGALPRLVVIDYAETRMEGVRFLVSRLAHSGCDPKVRLVFLARREGDWWHDLKTDDATEDLLDHTPPLELPELLVEIDRRSAAFLGAAHAFADHLGKPVPEALTEPDLTEEAFGLPLYLHMAALEAVEGRPVTRAETALAKRLGRERLYWRMEFEGWDVDAIQRIEFG